MTVSNRGFTIVELLIVVVVIAVLAAISVVAYNGIQDRANVAAIQTDLANFAKKASLFEIDNGRYPRNLTELGMLDVKATKSAYHSTYYNYYYCSSLGSYSDYSMAGRTKSGVLYYVSSQGNGNFGYFPVGAAKICSVIGLTGSGSDSYVAAGLSYSGTNWEWAAWTE